MAIEELYLMGGAALLLLGISYYYIKSKAANKSKADPLVIQFYTENEDKIVKTMDGLNCITKRNYGQKLSPEIEEHPTVSSIARMMAESINSQAGDNSLKAFQILEENKPRTLAQTEALKNYFKTKEKYYEALAKNGVVVNPDQEL